MTYDLSRHPHFTAWTDPQSGVTSYLLTEKVAPVQQTFYYTNPSISPDERWLWFMAAHPPADAVMLGVVSLDPDQPQISVFPATAFSKPAPGLSPDGQSCYYACRDSVYRVDLEGRIERVFSLKDSLAKGRQINLIACHLTVSADGRYLLLDPQIGNEWLIVIVELETGDAKTLHRFTRKYNHAQFSPWDENLLLIAQDHYHDLYTGRFYHYDHRTWLMDCSGEIFEPLTPDLRNKVNAKPCHEWWTAPGRVAWVDYDEGVFEIDLKTRERTCIWPEPLCHAHSSPDRRFWCADQSPYLWPETPCEVMMLDRETGRRQSIVTAMPAPPVTRGDYHLDPHPQFSPRGSWVDYTTMVRGEVDVALCPVADAFS